ncbi:DUF6199 family natural product biosynthesis protein [Paenibacillus marinisediminis]
MEAIKMFIFIGLIAIAIGLLNLLNPKFAWHIKEGWKVDGDSEPSDFYVFMTRLSGVFALVIGMIMFFSN